MYMTLLYKVLQRFWVGYTLSDFIDSFEKKSRIIFFIPAVLAAGLIINILISLF